MPTAWDISSSESVPSYGDVPKKHENNDDLAAAGLERRNDDLIYWRADCKDHPRNWTGRRKAFDTTVIILFELYT